MTDTEYTPAEQTIVAAFWQAYPTADDITAYAREAIEAVRQEEREQCAQIAFQEAGPSAETDAHGVRIAARIREQGQ